MDEEAISTSLKTALERALKDGTIDAYLALHDKLQRENPIEFWKASRRASAHGLTVAMQRLERIPSYALPVGFQLMAYAMDLSRAARRKSGARFNGLMVETNELAILEHGMAQGARKEPYGKFARPDMSTANDVVHDALDLMNLYGRRLGYLLSLHDIVQGRRPRQTRYRQQSIRTLERALSSKSAGMPSELLLGEFYYHLRNAIAHQEVRMFREAREIEFVDRNPRTKAVWRERIPYTEFIARFHHASFWMIAYSVFRALEADEVVELHYRMVMRGERFEKPARE